MGEFWGDWTKEFTAGDRAGARERVGGIPRRECLRRAGSATATHRFGVAVNVLLLVGI